MASKKVPRPCSAHKEWDKMNDKEKIETLVKWADHMTTWAEEMVKLTGKGGNGGPPPPKSPRDPDC